MDVLRAFEYYLVKITSDVPGMKLMLLDASTVGMVSMVFTQSQMFQREVFLLDRIENSNRSMMRFMKCVCFIRSTQDSIDSLIDELKHPKYGEYYLYFTNVLKTPVIDNIAAADEYELVKDVTEIFGDYFSVHSDLFSLNLNKEFGRRLDVWDGNALQRTLEGLLSVCLSLKKRPLLRYDKSSPMAELLAKDLNMQMNQEKQLFDFRRLETPAILLILDRKSDLTTPLLTFWTYEAIVHDLMGINNGRVNLSDIPDIAKDLSEVVLTPEQDPFFKKNMFLNMGDVGANLKTYVDEYQSKTQTHKQLESIADMKRFVEEYPQFKRHAGNVSKHVALIGEVYRKMEKGSLLKVTELEQHIAIRRSASLDLKDLRQLLLDPSIPSLRRLRLFLLYMLRYPRECAMEYNILMNDVKENGLSSSELQIIPLYQKYMSTAPKDEDVTLTESIFTRGKKAFNGLKGIDNIFSQWTCKLLSILDALIKSKLKESSYPFVESVSRERPQEVIIYVIGGVTYEESRVVSEFNQINSGCRVVLGGSSVLRAERYLEDIRHAMSSIGGSVY